MQFFVEALILCLVCMVSVSAQSLDKYSVGSEPNEESANSNSNTNLWILRETVPNNAKQKPNDAKLFGLNNLFEKIYRSRRKFPEVDSKGFNEGIFDEGFGGFSTMKKRSLSL